VQALIYCDPPYANTADYDTEFDHNEFYEWCNDKVEEGHIVLVSEYNMPDDWVVIFEKQLTTMSYDGQKKAKSTDKLFIHKSQLDIYERSLKRKND
jgi:DNA adenine methylase